MYFKDKHYRIAKFKNFLGMLATVILVDLTIIMCFVFA